MNEILCIGAGPSLTKFNHLQKLSKANFKGIVLFPDILGATALKAGITPDRFNVCMCSLEEGMNMLSFFQSDIIKKHAPKMTLLVSSRSHEAVKDFGKKYFKNCIEITRDISNETSNVGLFMICNAVEFFNADRLLLIGYDHAQAEDATLNINKANPAFKHAIKTIKNPYTDSEVLMNPIQANWRDQFFVYLEKYFKDLEIVNYTGNGSLFGPGVDWGDFETWIQKH